jgi:hypothetical protein
VLFTTKEKKGREGKKDKEREKKHFKLSPYSEPTLIHKQV